MSETQPRRRTLGLLAAIAAVCALLVFLVAALLTSIFERRQEARNPYVRLVEVNETTTDPAAWGVNWAREYNDYRRTAEQTKTRFGGSESLPEEKAKAFPWLTRMFAGYAFALDYRDRRGHAYMLQDQVQTKRVTERPQPGACLQCHSS
jgi:nitrite reductase (cytochrome c-552)